MVLSSGRFYLIIIEKMWYGGLWQLFIFWIFILLLIIAIFLYHNFYTKSANKTNLFIIYLKLMMIWLSVLLVIIAGKFGDDIIDSNYQKEYEILNQKQNVYVDMYACNQRFGIYKEPMNEGTNLTTWQISECRIDQQEHQKKYAELNKKQNYDKWLYRVGFVFGLLLIHVILYFVFRKKSE